MRKEENKLKEEVKNLKNELAQISEENFRLKQTGNNVTTLQDQLKVEKERFVKIYSLIYKFLFLECNFFSMEHR